MRQLSLVPNLPLNTYGARPASTAERAVLCMPLLCVLVLLGLGFPSAEAVSFNTKASLCNVECGQQGMWDMASKGATARQVLSLLGRGLEPRLPGGDTLQARRLVLRRLL